MDQIMTRRPLALPARLRAVGAILSWERLALAAVLALAACLAFFRLGREGYSNPYYAATVRSMLTGWRNFFYAAYDPGGFVTVDKPPVGFWLQAASAWLFGFRGWSLLLPQALATVGAVALLHGLVRRAFGPLAGLVAALALAVTPISVATGRNNTPDSLLVFTLLLGAWALVRAVEGGRLRWLLLSMALVGVGFNIKMLQAYLVLPAFALLYLLAARVGWRRRLGHLLLATVVLLAVSLSWAIAVDLTPPDRRPYVGGSRTNSVLELALQYNGLNRLLGGNGGMQAATMPVPPAQGGAVNQGPAAPAQAGAGPAPVGVVTTGGPTAGGENGAPGPLRFFNQQLAGQISWLLPLALLGLLVAGWQALPPIPATGGRPRRLAAALRRWLPAHQPPDVARRRQALLLWGGWLLTMLAFFSVAGFWHRYYLVTVAPAIAALVGIGVATLWQGYRCRRRWGWILPAALVGGAAFQASILADYPDWSHRLAPPIVGLAVVATLGLVLGRLSALARRLCRPEGLAALGLLALLVAPTVWGGLTVWHAPGDALPYAGPSPLHETRGVGPAGQNVAVGTGTTEADPRLVAYLLANRGGARYLVATDSAGGASPLILATGQPVLALHGFGADEILSVDQLADLVAGGAVRFFLTPSMEAPPGQTVQVGAAADGGTAGGPRQDDLMGWVREHCRPVPAEQWQSAGGSSSADQLYDCAGVGC